MEMGRHGNLSRAALRSGMDRKTAGKYVSAGLLPSEMRRERTWRTRPDPFEADWPWIEELLELAPELEAKAIFEEVLERHPGRYEEGQLRTLQRRIKQWRAEKGPPKEVFFEQCHRPGEALQTDFTHATVLGVTIGGEPFPHLLCHPVLPYSNWEWATVCHSESMSALRRGVQEALFRLDHVPTYHQTDNSTAATHDLGSRKRTFNEEYQVFCDHFGMTPRTTGVGKKEQNGDVEASHGALKQWLLQRLLLRASRDFESVSDYESWLWASLEQRNRRRSRKLAEDLRAMRRLQASRVPDYSEVEVTVRWGSTIRVKKNTYSVPSRLIGERVRVRVFDGRLEVYYGGRRQWSMDRLRGEGRHRIQYQHVIESLVRKPGAFERYRYREDLFPGMAFRRAYDRLQEERPQGKADLEYLRILQLATDWGESGVLAVLQRLLEDEAPFTADSVRDQVRPEEPEIPDLAVLEVDLQSFDALLGEEVLS